MILYRIIDAVISNLI